MNKKYIRFFAVLALFVVMLGLLAAVGRMDKIFISPSPKSNIHIEMKQISFTDDHIALEYIVTGTIDTPEGVLTDCPVGGTVVLNGSGKKISGNENDFTWCRPDGNSGYLVNQFLYYDYGADKPEKVKIKIGDVDANINGVFVHVAPLGEYSFDVPSQPDMESVSYPSEIAEAVSGLKMKIKRVDFSPSLAKVDACLTLPDSGDWVFDAYLLYGDQRIPFEYWTIPNHTKPGVLDSVERCYSVIFTGIPDYKTLKKGDISFVVKKISRNMPECVDASGWAKIKDELAKYNVQPVTDGTGSYCFAGGIQQIADPNVNAHLNNYIQEALKEEVEGPLVMAVK
jgi:hypothetical protein